METILYRRNTKSREIVVELLNRLNQVLLIDTFNKAERIDRNYILTLTGSLYGWAVGYSNPTSKSIIKLIELSKSISDKHLQKIFVEALVKYILEWKLTTKLIDPEIDKFVINLPSHSNETG